jgi:hypothetical protein
MILDAQTQPEALEWDATFQDISLIFTTSQNMVSQLGPIRSNGIALPTT